MMYGWQSRVSPSVPYEMPPPSYTLEYIDMIMTIRSHGWQVLFVPTARLEFRITEFSWRDIPYFMYKRSEATCHGTRDYLLAVSSYSSSNRTYLGVAPRGVGKLFC